ncbi:unnamed protein product, partial [Discosporangium mesarthrocarpum]
TLSLAPGGGGGGDSQPGMSESPEVTPMGREGTAWLRAFLETTSFPRHQLGAAARLLHPTTGAGAGTSSSSEKQGNPTLGSMPESNATAARSSQGGRAEAGG